MRAVLRVAIAAFCMVAAVLPAAAQGKRAFVVGIDAYDNLSPSAQLQKAIGDAKAMSEVLKALGYVVTSEPNVGRARFNKRWQHFLESLKAGDQVAFVFSGHGIEINGSNFLLPRDVPRIRYGREEQLKRESIAVTELLADLRERKPSFSLIVLDACRDNPFAEGTRTVGGARGLARVEPPEGTFIMFSAGANQTALDRLSDSDQEPTSIYTRTLLPLLKQPGLSLLDMADRVGEQVRDLAGSIGHRQTPAFYSGVVGGRRVCLAGCETGPAVGDVVRVCKEVAGISSVAILSALEKQHAGTPIAPCISARISELTAGQLAVAKAAEDQAKAARQRAAQEENAKAEAERQRMAALEIRRKEEQRKADELAAQRAEAEAKAKAEADRSRDERNRGFAPVSTCRAGETFRDCQTCPEMTVVPSGAFVMGAAGDEPERLPGEVQVNVTFPRPFAVSRYHVTFDEWQTCVAGGGCKSNKRPVDRGWGRGRRPVINVSWSDAGEFVQWLSAKTGKTYRLLSEAEIEYVTRAGTTTPFWWGSNVTPEQANYDWRTAYGNGPTQAGKKQGTIPVDAYQPNPWGLHQVHGNVYTWTLDCFNDSNAGHPGTPAARTTGECEYRMIRGGAWTSHARFLRSALRYEFPARMGEEYIGIRIGREMD